MTVRINKQKINLREKLTEFEDKVNFDEVVRGLGEYTGNVGIGTTSPGYNLHIAGGLPALKLEGTQPRIWLSETDQTDLNTLIRNNNSRFQIDTTNDSDGVIANRLTILNTNGNVGIGTANPSAELHVNNSSTSSTIRLTSVASTTSTDGAFLRLDNSGNFILNNKDTGETIFQEQGNEVMRITSGGNVGIGTTNPGWRLHIQHATSADAISRLENISADPYGVQIKYNSDPNSTSNWFFECVGSNTRRLAIMSNGGIYNFQSNNSNLSDEREKKNIESADSTWNCLKNWEIKKFHYNQDADTVDKKYGVIAQQVEQHCPEVVSQWIMQEASEAVVDEEGHEIEPAKTEIVRKGLKEQQMYWMAINALKEAMSRIEDLETVIEDLKSRIETLESK